jgi:hypothetical protein
MSRLILVMSLFDTLIGRFMSDAFVSVSVGFVTIQRSFVYNSSLLSTKSSSFLIIFHLCVFLHKNCASCLLIEYKSSHS